MTVRISASASASPMEEAAGDDAPVPASGAAARPGSRTASSGPRARSAAPSARPCDSDGDDGTGGDSDGTGDIGCNGTGKQPMVACAGLVAAASPATTGASARDGNTA